MPRLSITQRQRETEAGAELLELCQTITEDGELSDDDVQRLRDWIRDHDSVDLPARDHLNAFVEQVLRDGRITPDERRELYKAIEAILPPDLRPLAKMRRQEREAEARERQKTEQEAARERAREEKARNRPLARFNFMVAGVRHEGRAEIISDSVTAGDPAYLRRDRYNEYDRNAIEVVTEDGDEVGFVPKEDARDLAPFLDDGALQQATFSRILDQGRYPIPVVQGQLYPEGATLPNLTAREDVPGGRPMSASASPPAAASTRPARPPIGLIIVVAVVLMALVGMCTQ
jgi:hypothetical protein